MRTLFASLFIACFLYQALAFQPTLEPELIKELADLLHAEGVAITPEIASTPLVGNVGDLTPGLTQHFQDWLNNNNYSSFNYLRSDIATGGASFGGKTKDSDKITKRPIVYFHGNSDKAIGSTSDEYNGFTNSISYFLSQGYTEAELYITTWGPANPNLAYEQYHSYEYLNYLRNFVEAVFNYTKAEKIDVIAHSMGVTLARKVIKGGTGTDTNDYDLGASLADKVDTFIGISGANYGLVACYMSFSLATCGTKNGFYPGIAKGVDVSKYLAALNADTTKEGDYVVSMLSTVDDLIMYGDKVWGQYTSQFPTEDNSVIYNNNTHMEMKSTYYEQYKIITEHAI